MSCKAPDVNCEIHYSLICALTIRSFDFIIAASALFVLSPVLVVIACTVYASDRGPVLFSQRRIGASGRSFDCFKFRSMCLDADVRLNNLLAFDTAARNEWDRDHKLRHDPRITPAGAILRKFSLDELPQLWNVLRGEMSVVGPRPIIAAEARRYGSYFWTYCSLRPGLTGLWQVSGRNDVRYRRRVAMDVVYVRRYSIAQYVRIIIQTPGALLLRRGAY